MYSLFCSFPGNKNLDDGIVFESSYERASITSAWIKGHLVKGRPGIESGKE